ncbi:MAG: phenylalanine--tRNA ligase subunit alpha, partial [Muribaculaceae bacterium]|nr:phenylalanine--tRNA ligase subunit alpha [Muribaculaceae bacterium]
MLDKINALRAEIAALQAQSAEEVENIRIKYLSKKGAISSLMYDFRSVPAEMKREVGQQLNRLKNEATERLAALKESLSAASESGMSEMDLPRSATPLPFGTRHPLSLVRNEIFEI